MHLISQATIKTPVQGERLMSQLWQYSAGSTLGLYVLGTGDRRTDLAVASPNQTLEENAAQLIASETAGLVEEDPYLGAGLLAHPRVACFRLVPTFRGNRDNSQSWGWQQVDPLKNTFGALEKLPTTTMAGFGLVLRSLPNGQAMAVLTTFAAGDEAELLAYRVASSFAGVGAKVLRPLFRRRSIQECLEARAPLLSAFLRPGYVLPVDELSAFWHPRIVGAVEMAS